MYNSVLGEWLTTSLAPVLSELTPLERLFDNVHSSVLWTWLIVSGIVTLIFVVIGSAMSGKTGAGCILVIGLVVTVGGGYYVANREATRATTSAWEEAKAQKSTYLEKLHGVWVMYEVTEHTCSYADTNSDVGKIAATGCNYVTRDRYCDSYDDEGNCDDYDYRWYPWFEYEVTYSADLNVFKNGHVDFGFHYAPPKWEDHVMKSGFLIFKSQNLPSDAVEGVHFIASPPYEWLRIKNAIDYGTLLPGSVYNTYFNWQHADDLTLFSETSAYVSQYQELGLLPTINRIRTSDGSELDANIFGEITGPLGYDYDIVQFVGNLNPDQETQDSWQNLAAVWAADAGPKLQASLILVFAPANEVPDPFQWVKTSKALLMQEDMFGRYILPKNLVLIVCGVSEDQTMVEFCRMETGMFKGNEGVINDVSRLDPFPFDPETVFGIYSGKFVTDGSGEKVIANPDRAEGETPLYDTEVQFTSGVLNQTLRDEREGHGFHRVSMKEYEYKKTTIEPDPEQVDEIKSQAQRKTWSTLATFWGVVMFIMFSGASQILD